MCYKGNGPRGAVVLVGINQRGSCPMGVVVLGVVVPRVVVSGGVAPRVIALSPLLFRGTGP